MPPTSAPYTINRKPQIVEIPIPTPEDLCQRSRAATSAAPPPCSRIASNASTAAAPCRRHGSGSTHLLSKQSFGAWTRASRICLMRGCFCRQLRNPTVAFPGAPAWRSMPPPPPRPVPVWDFRRVIHEIRYFHTRKSHDCWGARPAWGKFAVDPKPLKPFELFPLCSEAVWSTQNAIVAAPQCSRIASNTSATAAPCISLVFSGA